MLHSSTSACSSSSRVQANPPKSAHVRPRPAAALYASSLFLMLRLDSGPEMGEDTRVMRGVVVSKADVLTTGDGTAPVPIAGRSMSDVDTVATSASVTAPLACF